MSLKSLTNRKLSSAKQIQIPQALRKDFTVLTFLNQLLINIFEIYSILTDNIKFLEIKEDKTLNGNESKRYIITEPNLTITLPDDPQDYVEYTIKNLANGNLHIVSNVILIQENLTYNLTNKYDSAKIVYISQTNEWIVL